MTQKYPGGFVTLTPPTQNPALGAATPGIWTLDQALNAEVTRSWPMYDPYYKNVVLNLHGNPAYGGSFITDASTNNKVIWTVGNASPSTLTPFTTSPTNGSGYFGGSSNYLDLSTGVTFGSGDYTLEFWAYATSSWNSFDFFDASSDGLAVYVSGNVMYVTKQNVGGTSKSLIPNTATLSLNTWYHIAIIRSGGNVRCYVNGTAAAAAVADGNNYTVATTKIAGTADGYFTGYISNVRLATSALYSIAGSTITVPTEPLTAVSGTQLLTLQTPNPANNNGFVDSSTNNFLITRNGNTTQGTFSPYGQNYSNYFDGSGDYLSVADNAALDLAAGDFTIEGWINTSSSAEQIFAAQWPGASNRAWVIALTPSSSTFLFAYTTNGTTQINTSATAYLPVNAWTHIALCRSGSTLNFFANGVLAGTASIGSNTIYNSSTSMLIGAFEAGSIPFSGYISNFRIVKGTAAYTSNFTPSTAPLTAISGTSLLTCQSNRFVDNSASPLTITPAGNTAVQRFQPFLFNTSYTPSTIGGSGYFDGTGDYLTYPAGTSQQFGTGNFTVECWAYLTYAPNTNGMFLFDARDASHTSNWCFYFGSVNSITWLTPSGVTIADSTVYKQNTWYHVAYVRSGTTGTIYVNGVSVASGTDNGNYTVSGNTTYIGSRYNTVNLVQGYITNARIVNGTAIVPPTGGPSSPLTAVSGTVFLSNMTNAGIVDNAMMNDLETVGNAQISTSVKKYGTGSMYFDGTGDYLYEPSNPWMNFGSGDFTIECWIKTSTSTVGAGIIANRSGGGGAANTNWILLINYPSVNYAYFYASDGSTYPVSAIGGSTVINDNNWHHIAVTRSGSTFRIFIDGTQVGTATWSGSISSTARPLVVGIDDITDLVYYNGYIDDLRITKGVARYVANFTPPTSQLQDQ